MVEVHQTEKKTPLTILETKIENKLMQFVVESDTSLEFCLSGLDEFVKHISEIKKNLEEKANEEQKLEESPKQD